MVGFILFLLDRCWFFEREEEYCGVGSGWLREERHGMNRAVTRFRGGKRNVLRVLDVLVFKRLNCTLLPFFSSYLLFPYLCGSKCQTCKCDMTNNCMISENKCNLMYIKHLQSYIYIYIYILLIFNALRITVGFPKPLI